MRFFGSCSLKIASHLARATRRGRRPAQEGLDALVNLVSPPPPVLSDAISK
jgi:hypothetical protein